MNSSFQSRCKIFLSFLLVYLFLAATNIPAQSDYFSNWSPGTSPQEVGKRVAENFVARKFEYESGKRQYVIYPEICAWYGSLTLANLIKDKDLQSRLVHKYDGFLTPEGETHISQASHVDYRVFGAVPLEIYIQNKDKKYLPIGIHFPDKQWEKTTADGITSEARYWIDDMYMLTIVEVQAYRATKDKKYIDRAALTMAAYLDKLQQPNGLFYHADDAFFYWGRGVGWNAAGLAELLSSLPKNHPKYKRIMAGYKKLMESLLKYQADSGLWRQLIDKPES